MLELELVSSHSSIAFKGEVPTTSLISGTALATAINLTSGTAANSTSPWLYYKLDTGVELYIAKKVYRTNCTWSAINTAGSVYGTKTVTINGHVYKVRLLKGGNADPATGGGGEWNDLIYPVCKTDPLGRNWAQYTDADLNIGVNGTWCQESNVAGDMHIIRGWTAITSVHWYAPGSGFAWRPVLEKIS